LPEEETWMHRSNGVMRKDVHGEKNAKCTRMLENDWLVMLEMIWKMHACVVQNTNAKQQNMADK
jgi:hypothetical protein